MNPYLELIEKSPRIEERLGYQFENKNLLALAFVHRSFYNEHRHEIKQHNERLEFLGDSILGLIVSEYLYSRFPNEAEGHLSHLRAHLVDSTMCAQFVQKLSAEEFLLLGRGEKMNDGRGRDSILADLFEALIAAIYLDGGMSAAKNFFWSHFEEDVLVALKEPLRNWKAEFQDYSQKKYQKPPTYKVVREFGPDHNKKFEVTACIGEREVGVGSGSSKKEAEQSAAKDALEKMEKEKNG